jgi:hypothetical protein
VDCQSIGPPREKGPLQFEPLAAGVSDQFEEPWWQSALVGPAGVLIDRSRHLSMS